MVPPVDAGRAAAAYLTGGLSVIAIKADGTKAPALPAWAPYQERRPRHDELAGWFADRSVGVAILGGAVSGGLEILDFDEIAAWEQWRPLALALLRASGEAIPVPPVVRTPSGGRHLYYRHAGEQQRNTKLARRASDGKAIIETRGAGGYVLAPGCPPACHPQARTYDLLQGDLAAVPVISERARALLIDAARSLSQVIEPERTAAGPASPSGCGTRPGDIYASRANWDDLLRRHGWRKVGAQSGKGLWCRPGKEHGISATTNYAGSGYLYVWSTNAPPFEAERSYSLFAAYALLAHGGDYQLAALTLAREGYRAAPEGAPSLPTITRTGRQATSLLTGAPQ